MTHQSKICEVCGTPFQPSYRVTAKYWEGRRFCSNQCRYQSTRGKIRPALRVPKLSLQERFWSKVVKGSEDECWPWTGALTNGGYGYLGNRWAPNIKAHRFSYEIHKGPIPEGLCVCHHCDNPPYVNPNHLFLGTIADNNADKMAKGRDYDKRGVSNPRAKLKEADVLFILQLRAQGWTQQRIADQVGVSQVQVSKILRRKAWQCVEF